MIVPILPNLGLEADFNSSPPATQAVGMVYKLLKKARNRN